MVTRHSQIVVEHRTFFTPHPNLMPSLTETLPEFRHEVYCEKTRMMRYRVLKSLAVLTHSTRVTDRTAAAHTTAARNASRGKKANDEQSLIGEC